MTHTTLISAAELAAALASPTPPVLLDCSGDLNDREAGRRAYAAGHIPGALHVHTQEVLSGPRTGDNGRNPLPEPLMFLQAMSALGVGTDSQVVAYDNGGGLYATRLWWLLRWIGHEAVAVLDGGPAAWQAAGHALSDAPSPRPRPALLKLRPALVKSLSYEELRAELDKGQCQVIDARPADRFRGENETLDAVGGHIPGARNRNFKENLQPDGRFKPAALLRAEFETLLQGRSPERIVNQCGSGVSACHNLLAMEIAGLPGAALYPGSWSEWSARPGSPIATGAA
jgi:thiosulfate/3-mercaptopyruvate sulfurtransferase